MIWTRDHLTLVAVLALIAGLAGLSIRSHHVGTPVVTGYAPGVVLSFEVTVTKAGGARGIFDVRLDQGQGLRVIAGGSSANVVPGDRVCVRRMKSGDGTDGLIVPMDRCSGA
jgi:hypothetical protein